MLGSHLRYIAAAAPLALSAPASAACPATGASLEAHAREALAAFGQARAAAFASAREELRVELSCLSAPPDPRQAALVHQVDALHWFYVKEKERALLSFQAMAESDPTLVLDPEVAPPGGPVDFWRSEAALKPPAPRAALALDPGLTLYVDGARQAVVPQGRPSLVVIVEDGGRVLWSGLVSSPADVPEVGIERLSERLARPALVGAGATAALSAGLWGLAAHDRAQVRELAAGIEANRSEAELGMSWEEARALVRRADAVTLAAQTTAGLALGLGVVGLVWTW